MPSQRTCTASSPSSAGRRRPVRWSTTPPACCAMVPSSRPIASANCPTTRCSTSAATSMSIRIATTAYSRSTAPRSGLVICEDLWFAEPIASTVARGAQLVLVPNASPFERDKHAQRDTLLAQRTGETGAAIAYLNVVGGQDALVFDGASVVADGDGNVHPAAAAFTDQWLVVDFDPATRRFSPGAMDGRWRRKPRCAGLARGGARHPRLLRQERLQAGVAGAQRRHRFLAGAGDRRRCAGGGERHRGAHAVALHGGPFE
jgi:hypothetical protein